MKGFGTGSDISLPTPMYFRQVCLSATSNSAPIAYLSVHKPNQSGKRRDASTHPLRGYIEGCQGVRLNPSTIAASSAPFCPAQQQLKVKLDQPSYASRVPAKVLRAHVILGALQLSVGVLAIIFSIVYAISGFGSGTGIWSAPFFIAAGISGLVAGKSEKRCTLGCAVTCLVFSIMASVFSASALIQEATVTSYNNQIYQYRVHMHDLNIANAMGIICCLLFAAEFVLAIVHSAFACRASCCCVPAASTSSSQQPQQSADQGPQIITIVSPNGEQQEQEVVFMTTSEFAPQPAFNPSFQQRLPTFQQVLPHAYQHPPGYDEQQEAAPRAQEMKQALP